ncbi:ferric-chelate reductase [Delitschia confertaspora ATCC 74209]|uniref:ferric-chelate reductase (NADPH) n=1 Tax=Delitschia confertaspora ATCC 74209 TaxID=1513339 RepID=A0A9P4JC23_9PLEO|nr:ferric-chelate reductase [Delitschia confertaspora ATCC 74209]
MDHAGMAMGSMSMGNGVPPLLDFPKMYWAVVGTAVAIATMVNVYNKVLYRQRLAAAKAGKSRPATPQSLISLCMATLFAIMREASNYSVWIPLKDRILRLPTVGRTFLVIANLVVLITLCFYGFNLNDRWAREDIGYRTGFVSIAQFPLIFLLAGKNNIIGFLTGVSHERLNWLHRWCSRCLLFTATIHMGYFFADWAPYNYIGTQLKENNLVWRGLAAWVVLVWLIFSSTTPIRGWCYEFFVVQHLISFTLFTVFVYIHTPSEVHVYIWIPVGLYFFDRGLRTLRVLYANLSFFHPAQRQAGQMSGVWACKADFTPLPHNTTRITIRNPPINWRPGQHVFLSCHSIVPLQSHPFTIASIPEDGKMEFYVKAEAGGTKRFFHHAEKLRGVPATESTRCMKTVAIEGPYGSLRPLRQFDTVVFLAGSTGATFTIPLLRDLIQGWKENASPSPHSRSIFAKPTGSATRHIRFIWVVKSRGQLSWFSEQLSAIVAEVEALHTDQRSIKLEATVYVTCDDEFTEEHNSLLSSLTAPNPDFKTVPENERGPVVLRSGTPSLYDEKKAYRKDDIQAVESAVSSEVRERNTCGPDGTCCCRTTVDDESNGGIQQVCCCNPGPSSTRPQSSTSSTPSSTPSNTSKKPLLHPSTSVVCGRPNPRNIIRRSLEQALGESAVVVCGPKALVADVKRDVVGLSDERAVHKGTGAQGVYLHTESFLY